MEEIQRRVDLTKALLRHLLTYIDSEDNGTEEAFQSLIKYIQDQINKSNTKILRCLLHFLSNISKNHHRQSNIFPKIEQILLHFKRDIKNSMSDEDISEIFHDDIQIYVFLFERKFLLVNKDNFHLFYKGRNINRLRIRYYLYPLIKDSIGKKKRRRIEKEISKLCSNFAEFYKKCREGENDSYLCTLIRNDLVKEFIIHVNQNNLNTSIETPSSLFETNRFLNEMKKTTLIEYAAFYGSLKIIRYLNKSRCIDLTSSMWLYSIHSNNPLMIHFLEEEKVKPPNDSYKECLKEAIKCYHNEVATYIQTYYINENEEKVTYNKKDEICINEKVYNEKVCLFAFKYFNFEFIPDSFLNDKFLLLYLCDNDYNDLVKLLLQNKDLNVNIKKIFFF